MGVTFSFPLTHERRLTLGITVLMIHLILRPRMVEINEEVIKQMRVVCLDKMLNFNQNCGISRKQSGIKLTFTTFESTDRFNVNFAI